MGSFTKGVPSPLSWITQWQTYAPYATRPITGYIITRVTSQWKFYIVTGKEILLSHFSQTDASSDAMTVVDFSNSILLTTAMSHTTVQTTIRASLKHYSFLLESTQGWQWPRYWLYFSKNTTLHSWSRNSMGLHLPYLSLAAGFIEYHSDCLLILLKLQLTNGLLNSIHLLMVLFTLDSGCWGSLFHIKIPQRP